MEERRQKGREFNSKQVVAVPPKGNKVSSADLVAVVVGVKFWVKARLRCQTAWPKNGHVVQLSVEG